MTTAQISNTFRIPNDVQRQQALVDSVVTSELREAMSGYGKQMSEALNLQVKVCNMLPPSLKAIMLEQNQRIAETLDNAGVRQAFANVEFDLREGWAEQVTACLEPVATDVAAEEEAEHGSGLGRLAEEREAITACLQRVGFALEGFSYLPDSPIPPLAGYLIVLLAILGEVANEIEIVSEHEADDE